jgi:hypothetical protein
MHNPFADEDELSSVVFLPQPLKKEVSPEPSLVPAQIQRNESSQEDKAKTAYMDKIRSKNLTREVGESLLELSKIGFSDFDKNFEAL